MGINNRNDADRNDENKVVSDKTNRPLGSGFEAPAIGVVIPEDYIMKKNDDGTVYFVPPEKSDEKE